MEAKKQALEQFDMFPFNTRVTEETTHQRKPLRALKESIARIINKQKKMAANNKTNAQKHSQDAGPKMLADKHSTSKTPYKAIAKAAWIGKPPCPNQQLVGCKYISSANVASTLAESRYLATAHSHVCLKKANVIQEAVKAKEEAQYGRKVEGGMRATTTEGVWK